ncbi:MAG: MFS transporter [Chlamydiales bacterium]|nr:MFS transporter [Chlamydiales bacterium]
MLLLFFMLIRNLTFASTISIAELVTPQYGNYLIVFYALQIIGAPFQAAYSDHSSRKKTLLFAFLIVTIGHLFLFLALYSKLTIFLLICVILNGAFGNVFPVALAALMDINYLNNPKKTMTLVMTSLGIAWLLYVYGTMLLGLIPFFWATTGSCFLSMILCYYFFKDTKDKDPDIGHMNIKKEFFRLIKIFRERIFFLCIKSYFLTEIVYFGLFYYHINDKIESVVIIVTAYAIGYIIGNIIVNFSHFSLRTGIILGFAITLISVFLLLFSPYLTQSEISFSMFVLLETLFSLGYGIFDPCMYAFIGERQPVHMRGKAFGLIDSSDNLSESIVNMMLFSIILSPLTLTIFRIVSIFLLLLALIDILKAFKHDLKLSNSVK